MTTPERCENCRFFRRSEAATQLAASRPEAGVHGECRRNAPSEAASRPLIVRHPPSAEYAQIAKEFAQYLASAAPSVITLPAGSEWAIETPMSQRTVSPNDWCGEWTPVGESVAGVYADWLEERGFADAAQELRRGMG